MSINQLKIFCRFSKTSLNSIHKLIMKKTETETQKFDFGLTTQEAKELLLKYGPNSLKTNQDFEIIKKIWRIITAPISLILLGSSVLTGFFEQTRDAIVILLMVILSGFLDFFQEYRSDKALQILSKKLARKCVVVRDGRKQEISLAEIVPGDIVFIAIGDILPADGVLLQENDSLLINESSLTGESFPVEKVTKNEVFAGSVVVSGWSYVKIITTGENTKFANLVSGINVTSTNAFEKGVLQFSNLIFKATLVIVSAVLTINLTKMAVSNNFSSNGILEVVLFSVTIAVGLTPELLPVIMSINKTRGSLKMNHKGVLVKKLNSIADFGSMDILCTDKTGTLTQNKISLVKYLDVYGKSSQEVLLKGGLNSKFQSGLKNPLDEAILSESVENFETYKKVDEIPYDFDRKRLSVAVKTPTQGLLLITKGQFEEILKICTHIQTEKPQILDQDHIFKLKEIYQDLSKQGYRVIAVAQKMVSQEQVINLESEKDLVFLGLLAFFDPTKESATAVLPKLKAYNINIKIITGDNELVTQKVCSELNFEVTGVITGEELKQLSKEEFLAAVEKNNIFARCNPSQKKQIIQSLQGNGHVVGYLGDGINDAPSLKASDVGISVDNAADVARESADMILLNNDLGILLDGVIEGRRTFDNTIKYMLMAISSNFGNMLSLVGAALFLPFLPMLPIQVLLNNSLYDISQIMIPADNVDPENLQKPKQWDIEFIKKFMFLFGSLSTLFDFLTFYISYSILKLPESVFQTAWFLESIATQVLVIYIIRTKKIPFLQSKPSKWLVINTLIVLAIAWFIPFSGFAIDFGFGSLSWLLVTFILVIIASYLICVEVAKRFFYRKVVSEN